MRKLVYRTGHAKQFILMFYGMTQVSGKHVPKLLNFQQKQPWANVGWHHWWLRFTQIHHNSVQLRHRNKRLYCPSGSFLKNQDKKSTLSVNVKVLLTVLFDYNGIVYYSYHQAVQSIKVLPWSLMSVAWGDPKKITRTVGKQFLDFAPW